MRTDDRWPRSFSVLGAGVLTAALFAAAPAAAVPVYGSNGVFGVTTQPREGWATSFIPPGRYRVDQSPSMQPYQSPPGFWLRCSDFPCAGTSPGNIIGTGAAQRDAPTFVDILPTDVAIALHNVTLTTLP
ncbi:hypothetical protein [Mycolicibacterium poriferae]|uniref:hypothetical protein n=1 Tax=Mycolicibacterium poriferae TaxID=39694 RepID=UPI001F2B80D4|nr:hypothetical protein [Mycolicibacterium poriferae]